MAPCASGLETRIGLPFPLFLRARFFRKIKNMLLTRLEKDVQKAEAEIAKVEQKLNNPQFVQKVPPQVLAEHQQRLIEWQQKRDRAKAALEAHG